MHTIANLTGPYRRTYNTVFQHPVSHTLGWREVYSLFRHIGQVEEESNGDFKVTHGHQSMILHAPRGENLATTEQLMELRHFIVRSSPPEVEAARAEGVQWLLVFSPRHARIYRTELKESALLQILPLAPDDHVRPEPTPQTHTHRRGDTEPEPFFSHIANTLGDGRRVLIVGTEHGPNSEAVRFVDWTTVHHPALASCILGTVVSHARALGENELLAKAREFYANQPGLVAVA